MTEAIALRCDGCGQFASPEHVTRRLQRLEWSTRYRPVHIQTLLLGSVSPLEEKDFLYSPQDLFQGEAALLLKATGISVEGKAADVVHAEFQRAGFFLTHVLECPLERESERGTGHSSVVASLLAQRLPVVGTRIRRSLKPKRVVLISGALEPLLERITALQLECPLVLSDGKPFDSDGADPGKAAARLREALAIPAAR